MALGPAPRPGRPALRALAVALAAVVTPAGAWARGGGGCLEQGTRISTPLGEVPVEKLRSGAPVWTVVEGRRVPAEVVAVTQVEPAEYLEFRAGGTLLRATAEHPLEIGAGVFRVASRLQAGDPLLVWAADRFAPAAIDEVRRVKAERPAFNLLVMPGGAYVANGVAVHNKGCFLPDTPVSLPDGTEVQIHDLRAGDEVLAFTPEGATVTATIRRIITYDVDEYVVLETERTVLRVTREHPFFVGDGTFETVEALRVGDRVFVLSGGALAPERIVRMETVRSPVRVYNLQTDRPNTYFAGGVAVHNKGGGGGGGGHGGGFHGSHGGGSGGSGSPLDGLWFGLFLVVILTVVAVRSAKHRASEDLDYSFGRAAIEAKAAKTRKLLEFLARVDAAMAPERLADAARSTFVKLQECWGTRTYDPMRPLLMPDLYAAHVAQLAGLRANHEIDRIEDLSVDAVDIVNVRYTQDPAHREFTALLSARARDYYVDDRTGAFLRGDAQPAPFQEFWTFQRQGVAWLLREIEQTRESDALREENFFEQFTDVGRDQVYGQEAGREGPAGPWLEKPAETKATRTERLLGFLVQTDKLWNRQAMLERARQVFLEVMLAQERGDPDAIPATALFPALAEGLRAELQRLRAEQTRREFRNLCIRKAELVLVRNYTDDARDEFTVRISAHAQRIVTRAGVVVGQDADVTPFTQFWTFGRLDGEWKLEEVLPPARGEEALAAENLDQDSSPEQVQWYYRQARPG
jgi:predicted lipid-binding transport protein (Tim44 family)